MAPLLRPVVPLVYRDGSQVIRLARHGLVFVAMVRGALQQAARAVIAERENVLRPAVKAIFDTQPKLPGVHTTTAGSALPMKAFGSRRLVGGAERQKHSPRAA